MPRMGCRAVLMTHTAAVSGKNGFRTRTVQHSRQDYMISGEARHWRLQQERNSEAEVDMRWRGLHVPGWVLALASLCRIRNSGSNYEDGAYVRHASHGFYLEAHRIRVDLCHDGDPPLLEGLCRRACHHACRNLLEDLYLCVAGRLYDHGCALCGHSSISPHGYRDSLPHPRSQRNPILLPNREVTRDGQCDVLCLPVDVFSVLACRAWPSSLSP